MAYQPLEWKPVQAQGIGDPTTTLNMTQNAFKSSTTGFDELLKQMRQQEADQSKADQEAAQNAIAQRALGTRAEDLLSNLQNGTVLGSDANKAGSTFLTGLATSYAPSAMENAQKQGALVKSQRTASDAAVLESNPALAFNLLKAQQSGNQEEVLRSLEALKAVGFSNTGSASQYGETPDVFKNANAFTDAQRKQANELTLRNPEVASRIQQALGSGDASQIKQVEDFLVHSDMPRADALSTMQSLFNKGTAQMAEQQAFIDAADKQAVEPLVQAIKQRAIDMKDQAALLQQLRQTDQFKQLNPKRQAMVISSIGLVSPTEAANGQAIDYAGEGEKTPVSGTPFGAGKYTPAGWKDPRITPFNQTRDQFKQLKLATQADGFNSTAFGTYQINQPTWETWALTALGKDWESQPMSEVNQEKVAKLVWKNQVKGNADNLPKVWEGFKTKKVPQEQLNALAKLDADKPEDWAKISQAIIKNEHSAQTLAPTKNEQLVSTVNKAAEVVRDREIVAGENPDLYQYVKLRGSKTPVQDVAISVLKDPFFEKMKVEDIQSLIQDTQSRFSNLQPKAQPISADYAVYLLKSTMQPGSTFSWFNDTTNGSVNWSAFNDKVKNLDTTSTNVQKLVDFQGTTEKVAAATKRVTELQGRLANELANPSGVNQDTISALRKQLFSASDALSALNGSAQREVEQRKADLAEANLKNSAKPAEDKNAVISPAVVRTLTKKGTLTPAEEQLRKDASIAAYTLPPNDPRALSLKVLLNKKLTPDVADKLTKAIQDYDIQQRNLGGVYEPLSGVNPVVIPPVPKVIQPVKLSQTQERLNRILVPK